MFLAQKCYGLKYPPGAPYKSMILSTDEGPVSSAGSLVLLRKWPPPHQFLDSAIPAGLELLLGKRV